MDAADGGEAVDAADGGRAGEAGVHRPRARRVRRKRRRESEGDAAEADAADSGGARSSLDDALDPEEADPLDTSVAAAVAAGSGNLAAADEPAADVHPEQS